MSKPIILYEGKYTSSDLKKFKKNNPIWKIVDTYKDQLYEHSQIIHPDQPLLRKTQYKETDGNWVYFPWNGNLIHLLKEKEFNQLRTNRNKNLITEKEQGKLYKCCVAFSGLSIGTHFAISLAYSSIGKHVKLADFDKLEATNLNRLKASIGELGIPKIDITARHIYEVNPYTNIQRFPEGLTKKNLASFLGKPNPNVIFEAIDNFEMKIRLRLAARKARIPVIMFTNLGDNLLVDIERFDLDKNLPLFNGTIGDVPEKILSTKKINNEREKAKLAIEIVGIKNIPKRALASLSAINKTLVGRPQLYSTVTVSGGFASYLIRRMLLGKLLPSGRKLISFKDIFAFEDATDNDVQSKTVELSRSKL